MHVISEWPLSILNHILASFILGQGHFHVKEGLLDEKEADPISWTLFQLILKWAIEAGFLLIWVYLLLQWNCMARSKNIGELAYHNFVTGDDYIKIRYDKTKEDQDGETI